MQLDVYLQKQKISPAVFAQAVGVSTTSVYRWLSGQRFPARHLKAIEKITHGAVRANDFVHVAPKERRA